MKLSLNVGLAWPEIEHVFAVGYRGQTVGKIWFATDKRTDATPWEWHLCIPMTMPDNAQGVAHSKAQALQALANSLHTLLLRTPPERIERAFQLSAAAGSGFQSGERVELPVEEIVEPAAILPSERAPIEIEALAAAVQAIAQPSGSPSPVAAAAAPVQAASRRVVVMKKRKPTVKVTMVTIGKSKAQGGVPRPVPCAVPAGLSPLPPGMEA